MNIFTFFCWPLPCLFWSPSSYFSHLRTMLDVFALFFLDIVHWIKSMFYYIMIYHHFREIYLCRDSYNDINNITFQHVYTSKLLIILNELNELYILPGLDLLLKQIGNTFTQFNVLLFLSWKPSSLTRRWWYSGSAVELFDNITR